MFYAETCDKTNFSERKSYLVWKEEHVSYMSNEG